MVTRASIVPSQLSWPLSAEGQDAFAKVEDHRCEDSIALWGSDPVEISNWKSHTEER